MTDYANPADTPAAMATTVPPRHRFHLPQGTQAAWALTVGMTILAATIRLTDLGRVNSIMFDETYYVKDAWSLVTLGYEGTWDKEQDIPFASGDLSGLSTDGTYVVHPPVGKLLIGLGMRVLGQNNPVGWRIAAALAGIIGVFLLCRLAWNLFRSPLIVGLAGLFLATDGMHVVMSRIGLLDIFLSTFVLAAFLAVVKDQQSAIPRLQERLTRWREGIVDGGNTKSSWGPTLGFRPWLLVSGLLLGLACGTKWSGIYAVAVLGLFVVGREMLVRRHFGVKHWFLATVMPDGIGAFFSMVGTAAAVYLASWTGWFLNPLAWGRDPEQVGILEIFDQWVRYHQNMWGFHTGLSTAHNYQSNPLTWLAQVRPTSFAFEGETLCPDGSPCVSSVLALGNPLLWWTGILALALLLWFTVFRRSWQTGFVFGGFLAMYIPWFAYLGRTVFTFYTVAFAPFVALTVAWMIGWIAGQMAGKNIGVRRTFAVAGAILVLSIVVCAFWFAPLWTGYPLPSEGFYQRMWLKSWI